MPEGSHDDAKRDRPPESAIPRHVHTNIETIIGLEEETVARRTRVERWSDDVARFVGSFTFVGVHILVVSTWASLNLIWPHALGIDPYPFSLLNLLISIESVLLVSFVLGKQNRLGIRADRRAHLDLQVNLLSEREITKALQLLVLIGKRVGAKIDDTDEELAELGTTTAVEEMARGLETKLPEA